MKRGIHTNNLPFIIVEFLYGFTPKQNSFLSVCMDWTIYSKRIEPYTTEVDSNFLLSGVHSEDNWQTFSLRLVRFLSCVMSFPWKMSCFSFIPALLKRVNQNPSVQLRMYEMGGKRSYYPVGVLFASIHCIWCHCNGACSEHNCKDMSIKVCQARGFQTSFWGPGSDVAALLLYFWLKPEVPSPVCGCHPEAGGTLVFSKIL